MKKRKIVLNDVALRESAQVDGGGITPADQDRYVSMLMQAGVDIIEIGYPGSSAENFQRCCEIVALVAEGKVRRKPILSGLARARRTDIQAVKDSGCDMVHIYIPASDELMLAQFDHEKYGDTAEGKQQWVIDTAVEHVRFAKECGFSHIQFSPEDAARAGRDFVCRVVMAVIDAGVTSVNLPDTTGLRILGEFGEFIAYIFAHVKNVSKARIACHCHNDSDHATANALQAVMNGVSEVQGTFFGLGERSGMTKFESIVWAFHSRPDVFEHYDLRCDPVRTVEIVHFIAQALGMQVPRHWVVVGEQNNLCSSGTHQAIEVRAQKNGQSSPYYSWKPESFGHTGVKTVLTQFSGKEGVAKKLADLGFVVNKLQLDEVIMEIKRISAHRRGTSLSDVEIAAVVGDVVKVAPYQMMIERSTIVSGKGTTPMASITAQYEGRTVSAVRVGNGPISAAFDAVVAVARDMFPDLREYDIHQVYWQPMQISKGEEALGDVHVGVQFKHRSTGSSKVVRGRSVKDDSNHGFVVAVANAIGWMLASLS